MSSWFYRGRAALMETRHGIGCIQARLPVTPSMLATSLRVIFPNTCSHSSSQNRRLACCHSCRLTGGGRGSPYRAFSSVHVPSFRNLSISWLLQAVRGDGRNHQFCHDLYQTSLMSEISCFASDLGIESDVDNNSLNVSLLVISVRNKIPKFVISSLSYWLEAVCLLAFPHLTPQFVSIMGGVRASFASWLFLTLAISLFWMLQVGLICYKEKFLINYQFFLLI